MEAGADQQIRICLTVGKPEACDQNDWEKILYNLNKNAFNQEESKITPPMTPKQERKLQRLLAYVIQVGSTEQVVNWEGIAPQLQTLGLNQEMLLGIKSALKVPQCLDQLIEGIEPDLAAIALPQAVSIALLDRQVNAGEDDALAALLKVMK